MFTTLLHILFPAFVLWSLYTFIIKPQISYVFRLGWKSLKSKFACALKPEHVKIPTTLVGIGWNRYHARVIIGETGVYIARTDNLTPEAILIPYLKFVPVPRPSSARLLAPDKYDFFRVASIEVCIEKAFGTYIKERK